MRSLLDLEGRFFRFSLQCRNNEKVFTFFYQFFHTIFRLCVKKTYIMYEYEKPHVCLLVLRRSFGRKVANINYSTKKAGIDKSSEKSCVHRELHGCT